MRDGYKSNKHDSKPYLIICQDDDGVVQDVKLPLKLMLVQGAILEGNINTYVFYI